MDLQRERRVGSVQQEALDPQELSSTHGAGCLPQLHWFYTSSRGKQEERARLTGHGDGLCLFRVKAPLPKDGSCFGGAEPVDREQLMT